jgi:ribonucleoside-diphosphate reductase alpha chain
MTKFAYEMSIELAKKLGSFEAFDENKETCQNIAKRLVGVSVSEEIGKYGLRNSQVTLLAPTGTISFIMSCDTTSLEPLFAQKSYKNLVGGGVMEIIPPCVQFAKDHYGDDASCLSTVGNLHWKDHIDMMAACQKHLNSAISKTLNLPNSATIDEVGKIYMYAWEQGLKSVTVYRDGSKVGQPLTLDKAVEQGVGTIENSTVLEPTNEIKRGVRQRLNDTRYGPNHKFNIGGFEGYILTGTYPDGQLGEIFIKTSKTGSTIDGLLDSFAISISTALQYGVPLEVLIDKFKDSKFTPSGITTNKEIQLCSSIMDYLFRWLEQNFKDKCCCKSGACACAEECACKAEEVSKVVFNEEVSLHGELCSICGSFTQRTGKCFTCINCGTTTSCG